MDLFIMKHHSSGASIVIFYELCKIFEKFC